MRPDLTYRNRRKGATLLLLMLGLPLVMIPLVGLAIDGTRLYIVQAKLSAAVDGAALGAGRLLGTTANTTEIAGEFLKVNFPTSYWGTNSLNPTITYTNTLGTETINISATVQSPLLFMRILGQPSAQVYSAATATRRNTRVELVLDQSGSMNHVDPVSGLNVFPTMINAAKQFVGMFTPGTDQLGLVALSGASMVAYPTTRPYNASPTSGGGPDTGFATSATAGPIFTVLGEMAAGGGTNTPEALSLAYIELQKAHYRDLAANGVDNNLNSIVFFTDGVPTSMAASPNNPSSNALSPSSSCTYNPGRNSTNTMAGWITVFGSAPPWGGYAPAGLFLLTAYDANSVAYWVANPLSSYNSPPNPAAAVTGCNGLGSVHGRSNIYTMADLQKIPAQDYYGNSTNGTGYVNGASFTGTGYDPTQPTSPYHMALAIWNASDNVGSTIRNGGGMGSLAAPAGMLPITIFTIGYTGNGGTDVGLLKRLANTQDSSSYSATQQVGMFIQVDSANNLSAAFSEIASSLLRLAK